MSNKRSKTHVEAEDSPSFKSATILRRPVEDSVRELEKPTLWVKTIITIGLGAKRVQGRQHAIASDLEHRTAVEEGIAKSTAPPKVVVP